MKAHAIERLVARQERRTEAIQQIRAMFEDDPGFIGELRDAFAINEAGNKTHVSNGNRLTNFEKIKAMFLSNGKTRYTAPQIMQRTGLSRTAVSHVLYKSHADRFKKTKLKGNRKTRLWRLIETDK